MNAESSACHGERTKAVAGSTVLQLDMCASSATVEIDRAFQRPGTRACQPLTHSPPKPSLALAQYGALIKPRSLGGRFEKKEDFVSHGEALARQPSL